MTQERRIIGLEGLITWLAAKTSVEREYTTFRAMRPQMDHNNTLTYKHVLISTLEMTDWPWPQRTAEAMLKQFNDVLNHPMLDCPSQPPSGPGHPLTIEDWLQTLIYIRNHVYSDANTSAQTRTFLDYCAASLRQYMRRRLPNPFMGCEHKDIPRFTASSLPWPRDVFRVKQPIRDTWLYDFLMGTPPVHIRLNEANGPDPFEFASGINSCLIDPFKLQLWLYPYHFVSASVELPGSIIYHKSVDHFIQDRQTRTSVGRYLTKHYLDLYPPTLIQQFSTYITSLMEPAKIEFARTAKDIVDVYLHGPNSCMSKDLDAFETNIHPVSVYESPDLAVAYIRVPGEKRVTARAVVNTTNMEYGRIYGDGQRLETALKNHGYRPSDHALHCTRILAVPHSDTFVAPYLDMECLVYPLPLPEVKTDPRYLVLVCNDFTMRNGIPRPRGPSIGRGQNADAVYGHLRSQQDNDSDFDDGAFCESCEDHCDTTYTIATRGELNLYADGAARWSVTRSQQYCESCAEEYATIVNVRYTATGAISQSSGYTARVHNDLTTHIENTDEYIPNNILNQYPDRYVYVQDVYIDIKDYNLNDPERPVMGVDGMYLLDFAQAFNPTNPTEPVYFNTNRYPSSNYVHRIPMVDAPDGLPIHPRAQGLFHIRLLEPDLLYSDAEVPFPELKTSTPPVLICEVVNGQPEVRVVSQEQANNSLTTGEAA